MKNKEEFARLISDVYNKNENVDYDQKMRKLKKKESRMREIDEYGGIVSGEKPDRQGTMTD